MTSRQKQDLTLFSDNTLISPQLLQSQHYTPSLALITAIQGTSPLWLTNALTEQLLFGKCRLNSSESIATANSNATSTFTATSTRGPVSNEAIDEKLQNSRESSTKVVYISFSNNLNYYAYYFKRTTGIDLNSNGNGNSLLNDKYFFINCFDDLFTTLLNNDISEESVVKFFTTHILDKIASIASTNENNDIVVFLENPEFLLSSTSITPYSLLKLIHKLQKLAQLTFIINSIDQPLIDFNTYNDTQSIEFKVTKLLSHLVHRCNLVINVKPLSTGRADDVTGNVTVSRGLLELQAVDPTNNGAQVVSATSAEEGGVSINGTFRSRSRVNGNGNESTSLAAVINNARANAKASGRTLGGGGGNGREITVAEKEYLFHVKKDGNVDLFYK